MVRLRNPIGILGAPSRVSFGGRLTMHQIRISDRRHRWVPDYYRIRRGRIEHIRAHWWPRRR